MRQYKENVTLPLAEIIASMGKGNLPSLRIKPNCELGILSDGVLTQGIFRSATENFRAALDEDMVKIGEYLDDEYNSSRVQTIDDHADALSASIENAGITLQKDVGGFVEQITENVKVEREKLLKANKVEDVLNNCEVSEVDYTFLVWKDLRSPVVQDAIINETAAIAGVKPALRMASYDKVCGSLIRPEHTSLVLPEESSKEMLELIKKKFSSDDKGIAENRIDRFFRMIFNVKTYKQIMSDFDKKLSSFDNLAETCVFFTRATVDFDRLCDFTETILSNYMDTPSERVITRNIANLRESLTLIRFCLIANKELKFSGKLVLTNSIINNEVWEDYVERGYDIQRLHSYLKVYHKDREVPRAGIAMDKVIDTAVDKRIAETIASIKMNEQQILSKTLIEAYDTVIKRTVKDMIKDNLYDCGNKQSNADYFERHALKLAKYFNGSIPKMQDNLYDVVLKCFYKDTLYTYLGKNHMELMATKESMIGDDAVIRAELRSVVQPLAKFLVEHATIA